jgi:hypothetical protein
MTTATEDRTAATSNSGAGDSGGNEGGSRLAGVRQSAADAYQSARDRTAGAYAAARERAGGAYESVRQTAGNADPIVTVAGGLVLGAVAAALLPRSRKEEELLGPVGRKINDTAREAARAAKEAGRHQLDELGLTKDGARRRLDEFTDKAVGVARNSAGAAAKQVRSKRGGGGE